MARLGRGIARSGSAMFGSWRLTAALLTGLGVRGAADRPCFAELAHAVALPVCPLGGVLPEHAKSASATAAGRAWSRCGPCEAKWIPPARKIDQCRYRFGILLVRKGTLRVSSWPRVRGVHLCTAAKDRQGTARLAYARRPALAYAVVAMATAHRMGPDAGKKPAPAQGRWHVFQRDSYRQL